MIYSEKKGMEKLDKNLRPGKAKLKYGSVTKMPMPKSTDPKVVSATGGKKKTVAEMRKKRSTGRM